MISNEKEREETTSPSWREQAVSRRLVSARARAEERVQRFLDAAVGLMDDKRSTDFTIQEVVERSGQSLRSFYQYFDGKDELLFALFEESVHEAMVDINAVVEDETDPLERLHVFTIRLHDWCVPGGGPGRGEYNRVPIAEFSWNLAMRNPERVGVVMRPLSILLIRLLEAGQAAGVVNVPDVRHAAALVQQTVMHGWLLTRVDDNPRLRSSAEETWQFCLRGLAG